MTVAARTHPRTLTYTLWKEIYVRPQTWTWEPRCPPVEQAICTEEQRQDRREEGDLRGTGGRGQEEQAQGLKGDLDSGDTFPGRVYRLLPRCYSSGTESHEHSRNEGNQSQFSNELKEGSF